MFNKLEHWNSTFHWECNNYEENIIIIIIIIIIIF